MNRHTRNSRFATLMALSVMASCSIGAAGTATADNPTGASAPRQPVKYEVLEKSNIGNEMFEAGAIVSYAGLPSENLKPLCDEGRARAQEYAESNDARVRTMVANHKETDPSIGDPAKFMAAFAEELARERAEHQKQMAQMLALQQESATALAQAAANMAQLAAALTTSQQLAAEAKAPETPAAPAGDTAIAATDEAKDTGSDSAAPAKRTRG